MSVGADDSWSDGWDDLPAAASGQKVRKRPPRLVVGNNSDGGAGNDDPSKGVVAVDHRLVTASDRWEFLRENMGEVILSTIVRDAGPWLGLQKVWSGVAQGVCKGNDNERREGVARSVGDDG